MFSVVFSLSKGLKFLRLTTSTYFFIKKRVVTGWHLACEGLEFCFV